MAAKSYVEVVIPELFDIYFNVIPHFHMIFMLNSFIKLLVTFIVSLRNKSKMAAIWGLIGSKYIVIRIRDIYTL